MVVAANDKAEVKCPYCGSRNPARAERCTVCSSLLLGEQPVRDPSLRARVRRLFTTRRGIASLAAALLIVALVAVRVALVFREGGEPPPLIAAAVVAKQVAGQQVSLSIRLRNDTRRLITETTGSLEILDRATSSVLYSEPVDLQGQFANDKYITAEIPVSSGSPALVQLLGADQANLAARFQWYTITYSNGDTQYNETR